MIQDAAYMEPGFDFNRIDLPPYAKKSPTQKCKNFDRNMLRLRNIFVS